MDLSDGSSPTGSARWNTFVDTVTDEQNLNEPEFAAQQAFDDMHWNRATTGTVERAAKRPRHDRARSSSNTIASPDLRLPQLHGLPLNIIGSKLGARDHAMLAAANRDLADFTRSHPRRRMIEHMRANLHNPAVLAEIVRDGTEVDVSDVVEMLEERAWREGTHGYWNLDPLLLAVRYPLDDVLPLVRAIRRGSTELAYQLIAAGAPFHRNTLPTAEEGLFETPCEAARVLTSEKMYNRMSRVGCLLISVASDQVDMADYLLRANPEIVKARDAHGRTALHLARSASMVQMLVEKYSADVNVNDSVDER